MRDGLDDVLVAVDRLIAENEVRDLLLAVEVLSPSSRRRDVGDKLTAYRDAGVPSYWVVDPDRPAAAGAGASRTASTSRRRTSTATRSGPASARGRP